VRSEFAPESPVHVIKLENVRYGVPSCMEKNNDIRRYTPMEARNRDLMYSAPMFVDVHYTHNNGTAFSHKARTSVHVMYG